MSLDGGEPVVGFIGSGGWPMTAAAAHRLVDRVWPLVRRELPNARLRVAGRRMDRLGLRADDGVEIQGEVPSGAAFMRDVSVLLFPPLAGSGTKVKVLEALASGLPVVTNAIGTEGVADNDGVVVEEEDEALARAAVSILRDPEERRQRGAAGLEAFKEGHTPQAAAGCSSSCTPGWRIPADAARDSTCRVHECKERRRSRALPDDDSRRPSAVVSGHGRRNRRCGRRSRRRRRRGRGDRAGATARAILDQRAVAAHRQILRRLDPHLCVINLHTPYSGLHATLAAVLVPRLRVVAIEHLPLASRSRAAHRLKRMTSRRLTAHVAVSAHTAEAIATEADSRARGCSSCETASSNHRPARPSSDWGDQSSAGWGDSTGRRDSMSSSTRWQHFRASRQSSPGMVRTRRPPAARTRSLGGGSLRGRPVDVRHRTVPALARRLRVAVSIRGAATRTSRGDGHRRLRSSPRMSER